MRSIVKKILNKLRYYNLKVSENLKFVLVKNVLVVDGYPHSKNFGDALNVYILEKITGKKVISKKLLWKTDVKSVACIGSILQWCDLNTVIWGAGFIKDIGRCDRHFDNKNIFAVRGYKTLNILKENSYDVGNVKIGDPALLLPKLHGRRFRKGNLIGILPHYVDKQNLWIDKVLRERDEVLFIDIEVGQNVDSFLTELNKCSVILSSSLHGLILADAYNIKNLWISFSENIEGGDFKFNDYYSSIGVKEQKSHFVTTDTNIEELISKAAAKPINLDLDGLLNSFPEKI